MGRFGGFSEVGVFVETEIQKLRRIALAHGGGSVRPLDLFKLEVDRPIRMDGTQQEAIDLGARLLGTRRIRRQSVTHSARGPDDPSGQFAAVEFPIVGVENAAHEEV